MKLNTASRVVLAVVLALGAGYFLLSCEAKKVDPTGPPQLGLETSAPADQDGAYQECVMACIEVHKQEVKQAWERLEACLKQLADEKKNAYKEFKACAASAQSRQDLQACAKELRKKLNAIRKKERKCWEQLESDLAQARANLEACIAGCKHDQGGGN